MKFSIKKKIVSAVSLGLASAMVLTACGSSAGSAVATVNGTEISRKRYDKVVKMSLESLKKTYGEEALKTEVSDGKTMEAMIRENTLDNLTSAEAILQDAEKRGIDATDEEVEKAITKTKEDIGGEEEYKKMLETYEIDDAFAKELTKESVIMEKHKEAILKEAAVTEEDMSAYFEENKESLVKVSASHILVDTEEEAREIYDAIAGGAAFEDYLAKSKDTASAENGGSVGYFPRTGAMVEEFSAAAFSMNVGDISQPVKTEYGYHIIRLDDKKDTFESLKSDIESEIKNQKYGDAMEKLMSAAKIEKLLKFEETASDSETPDNAASSSTEE